MKTNFKIISLLLLLFGYLFVLSGCKTRPTVCNNSYDDSYKGSVKVGDPYKVKNKTYTPGLEDKYDEIGTASWYGDDFHCKKTANGEMFNKNQLSAAHNTLPLPSVAKVTNLENGKSVNVIINDRGPFAYNRIIDLSEKAASELGMKNSGLATVRVQFLPKETNELMAKLPSKKKIFYRGKAKHKPLSKFEIIVEEYRDQQVALVTMRKLSKIGKVHLIVRFNNQYIITMVASSKEKANILLNKLKQMGYKNAKIHSS
jgi:rare lipoprotein A (peptidoglycan hydrolase)